MFKKSVIILAIISVLFTKIVEDFFERNKDKIYKLGIDVVQITIIANAFKDTRFDDIMVEDIINYYNNAAVLSARRIEKCATGNIQDKELVVKISFEKNESYEDCSNSYQIQQELKRGKVGKYIIGMEEPIKLKLPVQRQITRYSSIKRNYFQLEYQPVCVLKMEKGTVATKQFFTVKDLVENTKKMVNFIGNVLKAFELLNFHMGYYHGDVKPSNILFIVNQATGKYEPRLIDFDLAFKRDESGVNPSFLLYTQDYRPPELLDIVPGIDFSKDPKRNALQRKVYSAYRFSKDFIEEAYPLGLTIRQIIENNKYYLDMENEQLKNIWIVLETMIVNAPMFRISTKSAYEQVCLIIGHRFLA